jgi:hypothetical protein
MKTVKIKLFVLTVLFVCSVCTVAAQTPIEIYTAEELAAIGKDKNSAKGSYILMNDLILDNWTPIGFSGSFNGNGHTVTLSMDIKEHAGKLKAMRLLNRLPRSSKAGGKTHQ